MVSTIRTAQEAVTNGVLNRDTPPKGPRPTAKGKDRIQRRKAFMEDWPLHVMETYMDGLKEGKERTVLLACIKRKEGRKISTIVNEMHQSLDTVRGWLARGRDRGPEAGPYDGGDHTRMAVQTPHRIRVHEDAVAVQDGAGDHTQGAERIVQRRHGAQRAAPHTVLVPQV